MKVIGTVCGSADQAKPLVIGIDTVYVHTEIAQAVDPESGQIMEGQFTYHEVQYDLHEYLELSEKQRMSDRVAFENALCEQDTIASQRMSDIENALCEMDTVGKVGI